MTNEAAMDGPPNRNPNWTRDELILALDVYFDHPTADQTHPATKELSSLLNRYWSNRPHRGVSTFRNPSGVSMKLSNFQRFDPQVIERGRKGLVNGNRLEEEVWTDFASDRPTLREVARTIRGLILEGPELVTQSVANVEESAPEGALMTRLHVSRERNSAIVKKRKAKALAEHGTLACEVCGFDFRAAYGAHGDGYIEAHHTKPVHTLTQGATTKVADLALVCANCHRMIHARKSWLTLEELRSKLREAAELRGVTV